MQRYSTFFRLISIILTVALLMTTTTFSILAAEAAEAIGELAADLSAGQENPETAEIAETERLGDLLRRLSEYDSFTDAEKKLVLSALGMAVDEESVRIAQENQAEQHRLFDAMPYTARCELQIHGWAEDGKTYADLSDTQKQTVLDYLELDHARAAEYAARFAALEAAGYDLFEAMQIMSITKNDLFTLDEAVAIYGHYDARPDRDANVSAFADFATLFDTAYAADTHAKAIAAAQAASRDLSASERRCARTRKGNVYGGLFRGRDPRGVHGRGGARCNARIHAAAERHRAPGKGAERDGGSVRSGCRGVFCPLSGQPRRS